MRKHLLAGLLLLFAALAVLFAVTKKQIQKTASKQNTEEQTVDGEISIPEIAVSEIGNDALLGESDVYTFLQGPRAWEEGSTWGGEWCYFSVNGNSFGGFGCGFCCMANIYDTLSPYEVSPYDLCEYAMESTEYEPKKTSAAIDWGNMKVVLKQCGISCDVYYKTDSYEEFQQQMIDSPSAIVLVCSEDDDTFWEDTAGHYVNIWLYHSDDDTVFLAEPGSPENNRTRIPLRYVYDAMKTGSKFQYLLVDGYAEENNEWKADGIDEIWHAPEE